MAPGALPDNARHSQTNDTARTLVLTGHVQGVGFRPHVYRVATELGLFGWVQNRMGEVYAHVEGPEPFVEAFLNDVVALAPPLSSPKLHSVSDVPLANHVAFTIRDSDSDADASIFVPPDTAVCDDCLCEMRDPSDRRYRYPFINCTQCGPRYTLIEAMPYDRPNTTMADFPLCDDCRAEYEDPTNRRFHAEPVACPKCGPSLRLVEPGTDEIRDSEQALRSVAALLSDGRIVAVRGIGGYHLMCDARNEAAVSRLRQRKHRPDKPFAIMVPRTGKDGLDTVRQLADISLEAAVALTCHERPIVLVPQRNGADLAPSVAPGCRELGLFLPYSPLHELMLEDFGGPLVATSANLSGEPVLTSPDDVDSRLPNVYDAVLHHDRPIARPADDPVLRRIGSDIVPLRLGRGNAPVELPLPISVLQSVLALGPQMKATVALAFDDRAVVSPHIGEMEAARSLDVLQKVSLSLQDLYGQKAEVLLCDAHPGYTTSRYAREQSLPVVPILHHYAHASALAAEHPKAEGDWLTLTWDGVGLGEDGTLWGGDALLGRPGRWRRVARFRPFRLTGGDMAGREPWRSAAALCWATGRDLPHAPDGADIASHAWHRQINTFETTAAGRIFDAAACVVTGITHGSFEARGPMRLEVLAHGVAGSATSLQIAQADDGVWEVDWETLLDPLMDETRSQPQRAADFHASMAQAAVDLADHVAQHVSFAQVGLTGGVFQNARLMDEIMGRANDRPWALRRHCRIPCNDANISFGQVVEYAAQAKGQDK